MQIQAHTHLILFFALVLGCGFAIAAPPSDEELIKGTWEIAYEVDADPIMSSVGDKYTFEAGTLTIRRYEGDLWKANYQLTDTGNAKRISVTSTDLPGPILGLYAIENDTLKLLAVPPLQPLPMSVHDPGKAGTLAVLRRVRTDALGPREGPSPIKYAFRAHEGGVNAISFSHDGRHLVSGGDDKAVKLWEVKSGQLRRTINCDAAIIDVAASPQADIIASVTSDHRVEIRTLSTGELRSVLAEGSRKISRVAFAPDGSFLASVGDRLEMWDPASGSRSTSREPEETPLLALAVSPDGKLVATGSLDGTLNLWQPSSATTVWMTEPSRTDITPIYALAFAERGDLLAIASFKGTVLVDLSQGPLRSQLQDHFGPSSSSLCFLDDDTVLATIANNTVHLWDIKTQTSIRQIEGHRNIVKAISVSPDKQLLASASRDGTVVIWEVPKLIDTLKQINK